MLVFGARSVLFLLSLMGSDSRSNLHSMQGNFGVASSSNGCCELPPLLDDGVLDPNSGRPLSEKQKMDNDEVSVELLKRTREDDVELDHKRSKTVVIESDDDMQMGSKLALRIKDVSIGQKNLERGLTLLILIFSHHKALRVVI